MDKEEVIRLSKLARIDISESEAENLSHQFDAILGYVGEIKEIGKTKEANEKPALRNVLREDTNPHEPGIFTEKLLSEAPSREDNYVKVKKIL